MINISDVYAALCTYESVRGYSSDVLFPCCEQGINWVRDNLRDTADENDPLIVTTAAALSEFYFFLRRQSETDAYESYKVGDMTVSRNAEKELRVAERKRDLALARAHSILRDGGFCFIAQ